MRSSATSERFQFLAVDAVLVTVRAPRSEAEDFTQSRRDAKMDEIAKANKSPVGPTTNQNNHENNQRDT